VEVIIAALARGELKKDRRIKVKLQPIARETAGYFGLI